MSRLEKKKKEEGIRQPIEENEKMFNHEKKKKNENVQPFRKMDNVKRF